MLRDVIWDFVLSATSAFALILLFAAFLDWRLV